MQSQKFRNKTTGEIVTQVPIMDIANYEEVEQCNTCPTMIDRLETFTGGICVKCHAKKVEGEPITKPDFIGTINI